MFCFCTCTCTVDHWRGGPLARYQSRTVYVRVSRSQCREPFHEGLRSFLMGRGDCAARRGGRRRGRIGGCAAPVGTRLEACQHVALTPHLRLERAQPRPDALAHGGRL